ncbi:MAG: 6-pyruvoyl tetrahydropterin synthase family protein [Phycisphaerales bacterium]
MVLLSRAVRFSVEPEPAPDGPNGFGGRPPMRGLGAFYEIEVVCAGEPHAQTGYLVDIGTIDRLVREIAPALIRDALFGGCAASPGLVLARIVERLVDALAPLRVARVRWRLTPTYSLEMEGDAMTADPKRVRIRQQFEFAAAHRLHVPSMSDDENRRCFGKCNNPSGHGHNYRVEVAADTALAGGAPTFGLADLEDAVERAIIERFDHKHLNLDTEEFRERNPSVEHIAQVCYERLRDQVDPARATVHSVTVWETEKTSATYPAL